MWSRIQHTLCKQVRRRVCPSQVVRRGVCPSAVPQPKDPTVFLQKRKYDHVCPTDLKPSRIQHSRGESPLFSAMLFSKTSHCTRCFDGLLERRNPGKNGEITPRNIWFRPGFCFYFLARENLAEELPVPTEMPSPGVPGAAISAVGQSHGFEDVNLGELVVWIGGLGI